MSPPTLVALVVALTYAGLHVVALPEHVTLWACELGGPWTSDLRHLWHLAVLPAMARVTVTRLEVSC